MKEIYHLSMTNVIDMVQKIRDQWPVILMLFRIITIILFLENFFFFWCTSEFIFFFSNKKLELYRVILIH